MTASVYRRRIRIVGGLIEPGKCTAVDSGGLRWAAAMLLTVHWVV